MSNVELFVTLTQDWPSTERDIPFWALAAQGSKQTKKVTANMMKAVDRRVFGPEGK